MPRAPRAAIGGIVYHVLNRANARLPLFEAPGDYELFERTLAQAHGRVAMRTLAYCVMPNHWHLVLRPRQDGDLSEFMRWLTVTHTQRWHAAHGTAGSGHVYQGRYKSFPVEARRRSRAESRRGLVEAGDPLWTVLRYVEGNAVRAGLVSRAEQWRWGSLWVRMQGDAEQRSLLTPPADGWPHDWLSWVHEPLAEAEDAALRRSISRGRPFGTAGWVERTAAKLGLQSTLRPRGRPRKRDSRRS
jgi:putative transposase